MNGERHRWRLPSTMWPVPRSEMRSAAWRATMYLLLLVGLTWAGCCAWQRSPQPAPRDIDVRPWRR